MTLVTIWTSPTCAPCKMLKVRLGTEEAPKVDFKFEYKDVLANAKEAEAVGIKGVPTIVISDDTGVKKVLVGAPADVIQQIEKWL